MVKIVQKKIKSVAAAGSSASATVTSAATTKPVVAAALIKTSSSLASVSSLSSSSKKKRASPSSRFAIPRLTFKRMVRKNTPKTDDAKEFRFQNTSYDVLQEAAEEYVAQLFEGAGKAFRHAGRATMYTKDLALANDMLNVVNGARAAAASESSSSPATTTVAAVGV